VTLVPTGEAPKEKGELLAIDQDRIWLYAKGGVREFETATVREVRVERHGEGTTVRRIGLIGGLVSAIALSVSCSSVRNDDESCAAVGMAFGGVWALTGFLTSRGLDKSAQLRVPAADGSLRAYARFPAGLPKDVRPESLVQGPRPRQ
jgi:hypothetical protein